MKSAVPKLDKVFFSFGIPLKVKSDYGSPLIVTILTNMQNI